jgi:5-methylcytosine-specific restriction protein A
MSKLKDYIIDILNGDVDMPSKPRKPCKHPMCNELVNSTYCDKHKQTQADMRKQYDDMRGSPQSRGYDARWVKVRLIKLKRNPLCECCHGQGKITIATLVHHIVSIRDGGAVLDMSNLMSLCIRCHDSIHNKQGDKW